MGGKSKKYAIGLGGFTGYKNLRVFSHFISTWKTDNVGTSNDDQITLPLEASGTYAFYVSWGDGTSNYINAYDQAEVTHTYLTAGTYTVKIRGTINGWRFANGDDKLKILTISKWGELLVGNSNGYFYGCSNLVVSAVDVLNVSDVTNLSHFFSGCVSLVTIDISLWDVGNVVYMNSFLFGCNLLNTIDVSLWDVGNVINMSYAFYSCNSLDDINIDNWNIVSVTTGENMLHGVTLTTVKYDQILIAWEAQAVQNNVLFHGGNSKYTGGGAAEAARTALINDHAWVITDGGVA